MYLSQFSLTPSIFLFSFTCSHSHSSSRLHQSSVSLVGTSLFSGTSHLHPLGLHFFSPYSLAEWPLYLFLHLFLLFSLSHSSYQVTINASQLILTLLQPISFLQLSLNRMTTYSFMWLDFCTSLHKCCSTFVHNYRGKDEPNSSFSDKLLQQTHFTLLTSLHLSNKLI